MGLESPDSVGLGGQEPCYRKGRAAARSRALALSAAPVAIDQGADLGGVLQLMLQEASQRLARRPALAVVDHHATAVLLAKAAQSVVGPATHGPEEGERLDLLVEVG